MMFEITCNDCGRHFFYAEQFAAHYCTRYEFNQAIESHNEQLEGDEWLQEAGLTN